MYENCNSLFSKLKTWFMNLKITRKLLIGYFIIVLVPTFILEWSFYQSNYSAFFNNYLLNQQYSLDTAKQNFDVQLKQISSMTAPFENNTILKNYLLGNYATVSEALFNYLQYIQPLYTSSKINPYLEDLSVYGYNQYPLNLPNRLASIENIDINEEFIQDITKHAEGVWLFSKQDKDPKLEYYKMIYSTTYPYYLGIIKINIKVSKIFNTFNSLSENDLYLYHEKDRLYISMKTIPLLRPLIR